jgi:hypothetical protein
MANDTFAVDIAAWASEAQMWASAETAKKVRYLFIKVCEFSPRQGYGRFSTGHFMKNWRPSKFPLSGEIAGEATLASKTAEINQVIDNEFFLTSDVAFFTNNTKYADHVEYLGWQATPAYKPMEKGLSAVAVSAPVANAVAASME